MNTNQFFFCIQKSIKMQYIINFDGTNKNQIAICFGFKMPFIMGFLVLFVKDEYKCLSVNRIIQFLNRINNILSTFYLLFSFFLQIQIYLSSKGYMWAKGFWIVTTDLKLSNQTLYIWIIKFKVDSRRILTEITEFITNWW